MKQDNRISNLFHNKKLISDGLTNFPHGATINTSGDKDDDVLFLIANSGEHNEKIQYKNLKNSIVDNVVFLTGNQLISGEKTFADPCTFLSTIFINEIIDITQTGDISGNIFVGETGLFEKVGIGLDFTDRRIIKDVFSDFPNFTGGYVQYNFGGGIEEATYSGGLDFIAPGQPDLTTSLNSYSIYSPSGYYNSTIPLSQQNFENDLSLDGHSFDPDDIHREMGGAWLGVEFPESFNYKGFSIYRSEVENAAEKLKVVASNNGQDWTTIHSVDNLGTGDYAQTGQASPFELAEYHPTKYSHYRLVAEKIISGDFWKLDHFNFSGVEFYEHVKTVHPQYTLHVSGDSVFIGDITHTGNSRHQGDSLRIGNTVLSGNFFITGDSFFTGDISHIGNKDHKGDSQQIGNLSRIGNSSLSGDITQTGNNYFYGDTFRSGDTNLVGNYSITGNSKIIGDTVQIGDSFLLGDVTRTGDVLIEGDETTTGNIFLGEYLYHLDDTDTFLRFTDDRLELTAGSGVKVILKENDNDALKFFTSGIEQVRLTNEGFLGVNTETPVGELSVTGEAYLDCLFTTGEDGQWERVFGGSDEVVSFTTDLIGGENVYKIDFPKTFGENPSVTLAIENNQGGPIVPYIISGVNTHEYFINFGSTLLNDDYKIHTSVRATGQSAVNKTTTQSFITELTPQPGKDIYEIFYPNQFHTNPVVSTALENQTEILPYIISGISDTSYKVIFGRPLIDSCKIHTHAVR